MPAKKPTGVLMERNHDRSEKQFICCSDKNQSEWKFKKFDFFHNCMGYFFGIMRGENRLGEKLGENASEMPARVYRQPVYQHKLWQLIANGKYKAQSLNAFAFSCHSTWLIPPPHISVLPKPKAPKTPSLSTHLALPKAHRSK